MKILFFLQRPEAWINIESVWWALSEDPDIESDILVLPYNASALEIKRDAIRLSCELLAKLGINPIAWHNNLNIELSKYDAAVITHPYDRERPAEFWFKEVSKAIPITIYIPYGPLVSGGFKNIRLNFHQPTAIKSSVVIARSAWEKRMFKLHCPAGDGHVVVSGHPRFDTLLRKLDNFSGNNFSSIINGRLCVLWNSHFSFAPSYSQSSSFSTFDLLGPEIFRYAIKNRSWLCLLWRPHPGLYQVLENNNWLTKQEINLLEDELHNLGIIVDKTVDHTQAFYVSDALLTDLGSFFIEYLVTRKPLLALINPEGVPFNEESAALADKYICASEFSTVEKFFESVRNKSAYINDEKLISEHLTGLDGHAGIRVAEIIKSMVLTGEVPNLRFKAEKNLIINNKLHHLSYQKIDPKKHTSLHVTPVLDKLIKTLTDISLAKYNEPTWRKKVRKFKNIMRTILSEAIKKHPALMKFF